MRKILFVMLVSLFCLPLMALAQENADTTSFKGYLYNKEYNVFLQIDFYHQNVIVPRQEVYGEMAGYFGDCQDGRKWLFTSATIKNDHLAEIEIINDYGSEDLKATLTKVNDSTFVLRQGEGSTIKIARNRKWQKMPKELTFIKR